MSARSLVGILLIGLTIVAGADDHRASINYTLHCQGCHLAGAEGLENEVPRMRDFVGYYLHSQEGREFLIQVPGVATSSIGDAELAELMNWLLLEYSPQQLPASFTPYTTAEVRSLRSSLERDPTNTRQRILGDIAKKLPHLAAELTRPATGGTDRGK